MTDIYQVKVKGALAGKWSDWFNDMTIEVQHVGDGTSITTLTGPVADQARLRGIVSRMWDLNLTIVSVCRVRAGETPRPTLNEEVDNGKTPENGVA
ncbi:MAG: hypothetical protein PVJ55_03365 [Anaerolineae bacterium]|jgi:hypothetical protein